MGLSALAGSVRQKQSPRPWYLLRSVARARDALLVIWYLTKRGYTAERRMLSTLSWALVKMFSMDGRVVVVLVLISMLIFLRRVVGMPICLGASVAV